MKKIMTLAVAAAMLIGGLSTAHAIDFKAKGQWIVSADYGQNGNFTGGNGQTGYNGSEDEFEVEQRFRVQLDAVASESLSGTLYFEIGDQRWGKNAHGGALGADGTNVIEIKQAYIDWMVPQTDLKLRMGIQGMALPSFTTGSQVFNDDVAGITASYKFTDNVALTAMWARPMNDNYSGWSRDGNPNYNQNYMDNVDLFALALPLTFDGVKVTPWAMYGAIGPNAFRNGRDNYYTINGDNAGTSNAYYRAGMYPIGGGSHHEKLTGYGNAVWAGVTGDIVAFDPFRVAFDFNYGSVSYDDSSANRAGWLASLLVEYKMDWMTPGIYGWYGSGDDDNTGNGSERMPFVSVNNTNNGFSRYAFNGNTYLARESVVGYGMTGTWGVGLRAKDVSFVEDLKQCLYVNFMGGTNSPHMAKELVSLGYAANTPNIVGKDSMYLTTDDYALEIGLVNSYKIYDNLEMTFEASYIAMWLDKSRNVWGHSVMNGKDDTVRDAWNFNLCYVYSF